MNYTIDSATRVNDRGICKPNEDIIFTDINRGLFVILDGITRPHEEYDGTDKSAACDINRIFIDSVQSNASCIDKVISDDELEQALKRMALMANASIIPYRCTKTLKQWQYYPGTVGIIAALRKDRLCCIWAGDCIGLHLHMNNKMIIANQQTLRSSRLGYSKKQLYAKVCNHPENEFAYGIFNGDPEVEELLECSWTSLNVGDTVLLSTDGLATYLQNETVSGIRSASVSSMLDCSLQYDLPPFGKYSDDKAIIRIDVNH